jgi:signal transduction histidine kinase
VSAANSGMAKKLLTNEQRLARIQILQGIITARWFLIIGLTTLGIFLRSVSQKEFLLGLDYPRIIALFLIATSLNGGYYWYLKRGLKTTNRGVEIVAFLQISIDTLLYSSIIFLSGGITATSYLFYTYAIYNAAALYKVRGVLMTVFFTVFIYTAIIGLEYYGITPHLKQYADAFTPNHFQNYGYTFVVYITIIYSLTIAGAFSSVVSEIIERREQQIKIERDRVSSIIDHLHNGILLIDNYHQITFANKHVAKLMEMPQESIINLKITKENLQKNKVYSHIYKVFFPSERYRSPSLKQEYEITLDNSEHTILKVETVLVTSIENQMLGFMKVIHDVTREKAVDRMKSEFISIAAHQLRTPLSAIKWSLKMVLDGDLGKPTEEMNEFITKSYKTNERMIRLVNDLLNVSRIEEGRFFYKFSPLNLVEFINGVVLDFIPLCKDKKIAITWSPPKENIPLIQGDADHLRLAIQNLLDNALKYTPNNGMITISLQKVKSKGELILRIKDTGVGIPQDEQERIFSKFYRGTNVIKLQTDGSGLGLFIVKNIIERHDGTVTFDSTEKGTTFTIILPSTLEKEKNAKDSDTYQRFITQF